MSTDKMVDALLIAEEFITNELANREAGMEESSDYVQEARETLKAVQDALKLEDDEGDAPPVNERPMQTIDEICDAVGVALKGQDNA